MVIFGDFCYCDGDVCIYVWIKYYLDEFGLFYEVMLGNYDDLVLFVRVFGWEGLFKGKELYFSWEYVDCMVFFLDIIIYEMLVK